MKDNNQTYQSASVKNKKISQSIRSENDIRGFAKVVAGGRIIRLRKDVPFYERLVTGFPSATNEFEKRSRAILDSVSSNLEAGLNMVDRQETFLAKIGGRLSEMALSLNKARDPNESHANKVEAQGRYVQARDYIRKSALATYDSTALFSNGPAKPITIAVPAGNHWEGLSVDRINLAKPGLITLDNGKVYGEGSGYMLDPGSIKQAFDDWRVLCTSNRMQSSLLLDRLHGVRRKLRDILEGKHWEAPVEPTNINGPLRRPHLQN